MHLWDADGVTRVVVVGAGISGLVAAHRLAQDPAREVVVLEGSPTIGGKLRSVAVAGAAVDVGAEAMLNRRPEGVDLAHELGLPVVHPTAATSRLWSNDELRPMPRSLMGVPSDLDTLASSGLLSATGLDRARAELGMPGETVHGDVSVGDLVAWRCGAEIVDRLVEPLLGGVYAGHARLISARAAVPQLLSMVERGSLVAQAAALPTSTVPVFAGIDGGMGRLPHALAESLDVRTDSTVRGVRRTSDGFRLEVGSAAAPTFLTADQVVLATPAAATARLLTELAPVASTALGEIEAASVVVVTLAFQRTDLATTSAFDGSASGFLVPPVEGRRIKAATFSFAKWDWVRAAGGDDVVHVRTSLGRHREEASIRASDEELVAWSVRDLADATGTTAAPVDVHVQRWGGALPQYAVGHLDRVTTIRSAVAAVPGLAVCGAAYDGVGVPACIASAERAVAKLRS